MQQLMSRVLAASLLSFLSLCIVVEAFSQSSQEGYNSDPNAKAEISQARNSESYVKGITAMRARSLVGVALGLGCLITGWKARKRANSSRGYSADKENSADTGNSASMISTGRNGALASLLMGGVAIVLSIFHLFITSGAVFGSGSGKAGAIVAISLSILGISFSAMVLRQREA